MSISYSLGFSPRWYFVDDFGVPLGAGYIAFFSSLNKSLQQLVYQDPNGSFPWPTVTIPNVGEQGVLIDENGQQGPFFFAFDDTNPSNLYYFRVYDKNGIFQWDFTGNPTGGSGGGNVTEVNSIQNLISNNIFYHNIGTSADPLPLNLVLSPDNHSGFSQTSSNAGPDVMFYKNNTNATDQIIFTQFSVGSSVLNGDVTPQYFLRYVCSNAPASETIKNVQFPLDSSVQNLSGQPVTVNVWAKGNGGAQTLNLQIRQFFGDGSGASADVYTTFGTQSLTSSWAQYTFTGSVPNVTGKVLGGCGNDATFLEVGLPLGAICDVSFTKPALYLGNVSPTIDFSTNDQIDSVISSPRTGDVRTSVNSLWPFGWVLMNDGSIGSASSGATTRANIDTFALYNLLWNNVGATYAPMVDTNPYGASAIADFTANRAMYLTKALGRAISSAGLASSGGVTTWALGQFGGEQTHTQTVAEMPAHNHPGSTATVGSNNFQNGSGANTNYYSNFNPNTNILSIASQGGGTAFNVTQPTLFLNVFMKL